MHVLRSRHSVPWLLRSGHICQSWTLWEILFLIAYWNSFWLSSFGSVTICLCLHWDVIDVNIALHFGILKRFSIIKFRIHSFRNILHWICTWFVLESNWVFDLVFELTHIKILFGWGWSFVLLTNSFIICCSLLLHQMSFIVWVDWWFIHYPFLLVFSL